jgi:3-deoxy-D-manno-octulosonic-acid transferase
MGEYPHNKYEERFDRLHQTCLTNIDKFLLTVKSAIQRFERIGVIAITSN